MSIKRNFIYSSILVTSNYIFPFITYPYISRVLGVTNIGICNFVDSIVNYFILFSMMGIGIIGIREIASAKKNQGDLNSTFSSLFFLNAVSTVVSLVTLIGAIYLVPDLFQYRALMYIGAIRLLSNFFLVDWFYRGIEKFKYVTSITIGVKCLYVIAVFLFIHTPNDYPVYYLLTTLMITINAIFNWSYIRHFTQLTLKKLAIKKYVSQFFILGFHSMLTTMYTSFNVAYLGFVTNPTEVGYYTTATKLYTIIIALYSAFTGVMLPRISALLSEGKEEEFKSLIHKSIGVLFSIAIPIVIIACTFSPEIIEIISGKGFEGAIPATRIVMPLILIIGYEQIIVIQILMPLKRDKAIFINSIIGASVGILLNILLVAFLKSTGSAIVWLISEISVLISAQYFVQKNTEIKFPFKELSKNLLSYIPAMAICILIYLNVEGNAFLRLGISSAFIGIYFFIVQRFYLRNEIILPLIYKLKK